MSCDCDTPKTFPNAAVEIVNPDQLVLFRKVVVPSSMGGPDEVVPAVGKYKNVLLYYEKTEDAYLYSSDGIPTLITGDLSEILARLDSLDEGLAEETDAREYADNNLQDQIEAIKAASDVVDIVGTYQELLNYDTSHLGENDIIRVLVDETHDGATSYYRWTGGSWEFIGALGPFYTQSELDQMFDDEEDAREAGDSALSSRIDSLSSSLSSETSARQSADTALQNAIDAEASARQTADAGLRADIVAEANARSTADAAIEQAWQEEATARGTADQALQTAIDNEATARQAADATNTQAINAEVANRAAADNTLQSNIDTLSTTVAGKQNELTAGTGIDITNDVISVTNAGPTVVQTTGTSTTDVMSQNATTSMVYADPNTKRRIQIGVNANASGLSSIALGGVDTTASGSGSVTLGTQARATAQASVAFAFGAATTQGEFNIGTGDSWTTGGYNNSAYRLLTGVYDPQNAHDAANKQYVDTGLANAGTAFTNAEFNSIFNTSLTEGA